MTEEHIKQKLDLLPRAPGVYVFRDRAGGLLWSVPGSHAAKLSGAGEGHQSAPRW